MTTWAWIGIVIIAVLTTAGVMRVDAKRMVNEELEWARRQQWEAWQEVVKVKKVNALLYREVNRRK